MGKPTEAVKTKAMNVRVKATDAEGERTITAVVTSNTLDRDYERVDVKSLRLPLKGGGYVVVGEMTGEEKLDIPMLLNHSFDVEDVIGSVRKAYLNEFEELVVVFGVSGRAKAQDLMTLIDEGHLDNAFSITMNDFTYIDGSYHDAEVVEISMVFRGSNKDARVVAVKSLIKGESTMPEKVAEKSQGTLEQRKQELEQFQKDYEKAQAEYEKAKAEADAAKAEEAVEDESVEENEEVVTTTTTPPAKEEVEEAVEDAPAPKDKPTDTKPTNKKSVKETTTMPQKDVAIKQVKDPVTPEVVETKKSKMSATAQKELFVKQFMAYRAKDFDTLAELNAKAMEADTADVEVKALKKKAIGDADATSIYQTQVVSDRILEEYTNVGRVGSLVSRVNITGAETWKQIVQTAGNGFQPVGLEEEKQEDKPTWTHLSIEPKEHAMVVAWYDAVAKRTPLAVFDVIVRYIAREYAKLEDKIVLSFAGVTTAGGDVFPATGLVPILTAAGRVSTGAAMTSANILSGLATAYGEIDSDETITVVANRATWGRIATTTASDGRPLFTVVGDQVSAGALGTFNVAISQEMTNNFLLVGAMNDYQLVTNGGLETLFSQEASVGALNLFTGNASAIRASVDLAGKPVRTSSFYMLDLDGVNA